MRGFALSAVFLLFFSNAHADQFSVEFSANNLLDIQDVVAGIVLAEEDTQLVLSVEVSVDWELRSSAYLLFPLWAGGSRADSSLPSVYFGPGASLKIGSFGSSTLVDRVEVDVAGGILLRLYVPAGGELGRHVKFYADSLLEAGLSGSKPADSNTVYLAGHVLLGLRPGIGIQIHLPN